MDEENLKQNSDELNDEIDLRDIFKIIYRRKWIIISVTGLCVCIAVVFSYFILDPIYQAKSIVLVTQGDDKQTIKDDGDLESLIQNLSRLPEMKINTYVRQIKMPAIMQNTIDALDLDELGYSVGGITGLVSANSVKDTNLIEISAKNINPLLAKDIANEVAKQTLSFISKTNQDQMGKSLEFLEQQSDSVKEELQNLRIEKDLINKESRNIEYLEELKEGKTKDLMEFKSRYMKVKIQHKQNIEGKKVLEASPSEENEKKLEQKNLLLAEEKVELRELNSYIVNLDNEIEGIQKELVDKNSTYLSLEEKIKELENTNNILQAEILQTQITQSVNVGETKLQIISEAVEPRSPIKPNKRLNLAISFVLGLMISVGGVLLIEFFDTTFRTKEDVEKKLHIPVLGSVPSYKNVKNRKK